MRDIIDEVEYKDANRDHSLEAINSEEKQEIALFHSLKQDPFYRHYLKTYLSRYADEMSENALSATRASNEIDPDDFIKFDRINLFDFRRTLPQKERQPKIDVSGRSWGSGKRKTSIAVANVKAGSGIVTINGKPLL